MRGGTIALWLAALDGGLGPGCAMTSGLAMARALANPFLHMGAPTQPPRGFTEMCGVQPALCASFAGRGSGGGEGGNKEGRLGEGIDGVAQVPSGTAVASFAGATAGFAGIGIGIGAGIGPGTPTGALPAWPLALRRNGQSTLHITCHVPDFPGLAPSCRVVSAAGGEPPSGGTVASLEPAAAPALLPESMARVSTGWVLVDGIVLETLPPETLPPATLEVFRPALSISARNGPFAGLVARLTALPPVPERVLVVPPASSDLAGALPPPSAPDEQAVWRKLLARVNAHVNAHVFQQSDMATYGVPELWRPSGDGPRAVGDCEDLALEKRVELLASHFPPERLFLAVVWRRDAGLHTVLVARLDDGDLVLDSRVDFIEPWDRAGYSWVSVEAPGQPQEWHEAA